MIKIENIKKKYGSKVIFEDVSFEFENSIYFIIGSNGSGKSTLLKMIAGIDDSYSGKIVASNVFYLPEKLNLPKDLMTYELINQYSKINKCMGNFIELASKYELDNLPIRKISKGMIQKVGIIISLLDKYDVILYDEPLEGLDHKSIKTFFDDIKKIRNSTIIISIHEIPKNLKVNAKKIYIRSGMLCEE